MGAESEKMSDYIQVSTYQFKCNIAKYIRLLQKDGAIKRVLIKHYNKPVAMVVPLLWPDDEDG